MIFIYLGTTAIVKEPSNSKLGLDNTIEQSVISVGAKTMADMFQFLPESITFLGKPPNKPNIMESDLSLLPPLQSLGLFCHNQTIQYTTSLLVESENQQYTLTGIFLTFFAMNLKPMD